MRLRIALCLGTGLGRAVVQAASEFRVRESVGVELARSRHALAVKALSLEDSTLASRVRLLQGDCADAALWSEANAPLARATVVYAASLLFSSELMARLAQRIEASESVRVVASLKRWHSGLVGFREEEPPERCETSWTAKLAVVSDGPAYQSWSNEAGPARNGIEAEAHPGSQVYIYVRES